LQSAIISRLKVMAHMDIAERRLPAGRPHQSASRRSDNRRPRFHHPDGEWRIDQPSPARPRPAKQFWFERLDLSPAQTRIMKSLLAQPNGIVLVTGPTGSGKSDFPLLLPQQHQLPSSAASSRSKNR
jgi:type II secretory ATPase GspE/PulE/Tfp pilus assembly ATPase PilB-like protein